MRELAEVSSRAHAAQYLTAIVVCRYVAFLTERKTKSFGTAHKKGIGWKLYVPGMSKTVDPVVAEREPDIFPADVSHLGAC